MHRLRIIFMTTLLFSSPALATVTFSPDNIKVSSGVKSWSNSIKLKAQRELLHYKDKDGYTECKRTVEINNVVLCGTYLQRDMNAMLLRATIFAEGGIAGHKKGQVVATDIKTLRSHADIIGGHDLRSQDLANFYNTAMRKCQQAQNYCLTPIEMTFYNNVFLPLQKQEKTFVVISFSVQSALTPNQIVSHEFLHAIYFLDPKYKTRISKFWNTKLSRLERFKIKKQLKALGYNTRDDGLMQNEFQAYMLMDGAEEARLGGLVHKFEPKMFRFLTMGKHQMA